MQERGGKELLENDHEQRKRVRSIKQGRAGPLLAAWAFSSPERGKKGEYVSTDSACR